MQTLHLGQSGCIIKLEAVDSKPYPKTGCVVLYCRAMNININDLFTERTVALTQFHVHRLPFTIHNNIMMPIGVYHVG